MNYNNAPKKKKKSKLGLIIIIIVVLIQIISAVFTVSADNDTTTDNNYNGGNGTNKDIKFPDYPDFSTLYGDNSSDDALSSESSSTIISSSTTSSKYNSSYGTNSKYNSSYGTNSYNNNNNVNKEEETSNGIDITSYSGYLYNQLSNTGKTVFLSFMKELASGGRTCVFKNVTNKSTFKAELDKAIVALTYERPEFFWISGAYTYWYSNKTFKVELQSFDYWKYSSNPQKYIDALDASVKKIANAARKYPTDFERVQYVHDYIAQTVVYNDEACAEKDNKVRKPTTEQAFSAYGCLVDGNAICGGYSKGFQMVLRELGIECIYLTGYAGEYHAWNCVKLGGEYYYFDVTWDDPSFKNDKGKIMTNTVVYNYFGNTSQQMSLDHTILENFKFPTCVATKYNYFNYKGFVLNKYDFNSFNSIVSKQSDKLITSVKFTSLAELNKAKADLIDNYNWSKITLFGGKPVKYYCDTKGLEFRFYRY